MTNINLNIHPVPESPENERQPKIPQVIEGNTDAFGQRVIQLAGPEMSQVPTLAQSVEQLRRALPSPQRVSAAPVVAHLSSQQSSPIIVIPQASSSTSKPYSPQEVVKGVAISTGLTASTAVAATAIPGYIASGAPGAGVALFLGAGSVATQTAIWGPLTYGLGVVHNYLWKKEGKPRPGALGTVFRGIVAPVTIPVGVLRNLTWNRKGKK